MEGGGTTQQTPSNGTAATLAQVMNKRLPQTIAGALVAVPPETCQADPIGWDKIRNETERGRRCGPTPRRHSNANYKSPGIEKKVTTGAKEFIEFLGYEFCCEEKALYSFDAFSYGSSSHKSLK